LGRYFAIESEKLDSAVFPTAPVIAFDEMISSPARLAILAALVPGPAVSFTAMKEATGLADGNLHVQAAKLAEVGYVDIRKTRRGGRRLTEYRLTELGLERFRLHVRRLQAVLDSEVPVTRPVLASERQDDSEVWA
jgi:DNA-binding transcriptional ArsR family regulator